MYLFKFQTECPRGATCSSSRPPPMTRVWGEFFLGGMSCFLGAVNFWDFFWGEGVSFIWRGDFFGTGGFFGTVEFFFGGMVFFGMGGFFSGWVSGRSLIA